MKHIYFVRHGETKANIKKIHQSPDEPLTIKGQKQAEHAALLLRERGIDTLICSPYKRARQTAEVISSEVHVPIIFDQCFIEFKRPDTLQNRGHFSVPSMVYMWRMFLHREKATWNDHGAENMFAIRNRVIDAKRILTGQSGTHIAVVSHAIFINVFLEMVCRDTKVTFVDFIKTLLRAKRTHNGSIFHIQYDENAPKGVCPWQFIEILGAPKKPQSTTKA